MKKTISVKMNDDDLEKINQYCDNNNINKNDLIKRSLKNITEPTPGNQTQEPTPDSQTQEFSIKKMIDELDNENKIRSKIEPQIKDKTQDDILNHIKNKNCGFGCNICEVKHGIRNTAMQEQEDKDSKLLNKTYQEFIQKENRAYQTGILNGIMGMNQNKDRSPKDVYDFVVQKTLSPKIR